MFVTSAVGENRKKAKTVSPKVIADELAHIESFDGKMRDVLLDREIFFTRKEAKILIAHWREAYNLIRPHSALGYRPPAPQAWLLAPQLVRTPGFT